MRTRLLAIAGVIIILMLGVLIFSRPKDKVAPLGAQRLSRNSYSAMLKEVAKQESSGNFLEAKKLYEQLVNDFPNTSKVEDWQKKAGDLSIKLLFSPLITEGSIIYEGLR